MANIIAVDFDGTCVTHDYPAIGKDIGAIPVLKKLVKAGNKLILFTMRSDKELIDAVTWFEKNDIKLWGINNNPQQKSWTNSRKVYAHLYIDDLALGCPTKTDRKLSNRDFVDWKIVEKLLKEKRFLE